MALKTWLRELRIEGKVYRVYTDFDKWHVTVYHPHVGWTEPVEFGKLKEALAYVRERTGLTPTI